MDADKLNILLKTTVDAQVAEILQKKQPDAQYLDYNNLQFICNRLEYVFHDHSDCIPNRIKTVTELALAVLAPSTAEKEKRVKSAIATGSGLAGMAAVITAVGTALGWGTTIIGSIIAIFTGSSLLGPIGWGVAGAAGLGIAAYFVLSDDTPQEKSDKALEVLRKGLDSAMPDVWQEIAERWHD